MLQDYNTGDFLGPCVHPFQNQIISLIFAGNSLAELTTCKWLPFFITKSVVKTLLRPFLSGVKSNRSLAISQEVVISLRYYLLT